MEERDFVAAGAAAVQMPSRAIAAEQMGIFCFSACPEVKESQIEAMRVFGITEQGLRISCPMIHQWIDFRVLHIMQTRYIEKHSSDALEDWEIQRGHTEPYLVKLARISVEKCEKNMELLEWEYNAITTT